MSKVNYMTQEGLDKLKSELVQMRNVERPRISRQIAEARDKGDLSENAEYDAAKEAQGMLEMKIVQLEEVIRNARVIDQSQLDRSKVQVLATVTLKDLKKKSQMKYTLVPESEADFKAKKLSVSSPIAKGIMGKTVGDMVKIQVPNGLLELEIMDIEY